MKPSALATYRANEFSTRFSMWKGQELYRGGQRVDLGYFGGNGDELFAGSPEALDDIHTFRAMRITGLSLYLAGLGMMVADIALLASGSDAVAERSSPGEVGLKPLFWALFIPGVGAGLTGAFLMQGANGPLSDAVEHYNGDLARRLDRQAILRKPSGLTLHFSAAF
jgi:hypothetical protein